MVIFDGDFWLLICNRYFNNCIMMFVPLSKMNVKVNIFFATEHIITTWNIYTPLGDVIQTDNMADLYGDWIYCTKLV